MFTQTKDCHVEKEMIEMELNAKKSKITRRTFLKLSASVAAVVAASNLLSKNHGTSLVARAKAAGLTGDGCLVPGRLQNVHAGRLPGTRPRGGRSGCKGRRRPTRRPE